MQRFIDPLTLARVKDLPLIAKIIARGVLQGQHASQQRGSGVEFSQYRSYEPGDSLAKIDWKLFARSDKYFVREAERESDMNVWLVLDASLSMQQVSLQQGNQTGWNKLEYAQHLLATIGYLAQQQGDAVGLFSISADQLTFVPARTGQTHWQQSMVKLAGIQCAGRFPDFTHLQQHINQLGKHGLIVFVSDFYQQQDEIITALTHSSNPRTDVLAVQLESDDERHFPYKGQIRFTDRETGQERLLSAKAVRGEYLENRQRFNQRLTKQCTDNQIQLFRTSIDEPLDQTMVDLLQARLRQHQ